MPPAPNLAAAAATQALVSLMPGEDLLRTFREREDGSWPALAEGKLHRLLKWLAKYQAGQKTDVSSTVACLAAVTAAGSADVVLSSWHCTMLPCCNYGVWIKRPKCPRSGTTTRYSCSNPSTTGSWLHHQTGGAQNIFIVLGTPCCNPELLNFKCTEIKLPNLKCTEITVLERVLFGSSLVST